MVVATGLVRVPSTAAKLAKFGEKSEKKRLTAEENLKKQTEALVKQMYVIGDVHMPPPTALQSLNS